MYVGGTGGYEHVISMCVRVFAWLSCFICLCGCVFALAGVIAFLVCVCMSVNNEPPIPLLFNRAVVTS